MEERQDVTQMIFAPRAVTTALLHPLKSKSLVFRTGKIIFNLSVTMIVRKQNSVLLHLQLFQVVAFLEARDAGITFILIVFTM